MFKSILVFLTFVTALVSANMGQFREECKTELNIPQESIDKYKNWNFENDEHAASYIKCFFEKMGLVTDGQFNVDAIAQKLCNENKTSEAWKPEIQACIDNSIAESSQRIFKGFTCFIQNNINIVKESVKNN